VVGVQLDEEMFPGTTVPKSALIISLFSLFGMGNSDRFSIGFAVTRCFLVDKPWDCKPTNALEELLWAPKPHPDFPNLRWLDSFWLTELDLQAHGTNLLWRLITENSDIKCVQQKPLFPADPVTNPVLCVLSKTSFWSTLSTILLAAVEGVLTLYQQNPTLYDILAAGIFGLLVIVLWYWFDRNRGLNVPPVFRGWPVLGQALAFQKDPKSLLLRGFDKYGQTPSKVFGLQLASLTHFVISDPIDLKLMEADNPYEVKFSLHAFLSAINAPLIVHKDNFESDLHTKLIRIHLGSPEVVSQFGQTIMRASDRFFQQRLSSTVDRQFIPKFVPILMDYITTVVGCCIIGDEVFDHPDLLKIFIRFNDHAIQAMGISALLPSFLQCIAGWSVNKDFKSARKILLPIIAQRRRANQRGAKSSRVTFLDFVLDVVDDDERAAGEFWFIS
jgi:peroxidase